jgi:hypothetical protein
VTTVTESNARQYEETATTASAVEGDAWDILGYQLVDAPLVGEGDVLGREDVQEALAEAIAELRDLKSRNAT